ncbi:hypothetical protein PUN28_001424 [Cardiocondyla obscurior]|uniref:Uncharacterized protein n=1 Tax=Cardiocondyla obscurior TaxID=286306 RepID=A0AAW2H5K2_9HYME
MNDVLRHRWKQLPFVRSYHFARFCSFRINKELKEYHSHTSEYYDALYSISVM